MYNILKTKVMKKNFLWNMLATMMVGLLSVSFVSCGGDDPADEVTVAPPSASFSENGGSQSFQVTSNTSWTVSGAPSWLTVGPMSGSGNGSISVSANQNTEKSSRNCILYVTAGKATATISIMQSAKNTKTVTVTNNSTYTLYRFRVVFLNNRLEQLTDRDFGTLDPGTTITADIPTAATEYYMATYLSGRWYFSANYSVDYTDMILTTAEVNNWSANSSSSRYPKASTAN